VAPEARAGATLGWAVGRWATAMEAVLQVVVASAAAAGAATAAATAVQEGAGALTALEEGLTAGPRRTDDRIVGGSWRTTRPCSRCGSTRSCRHCTWPAHLVTRSESGWAVASGGAEVAEGAPSPQGQSSWLQRRCSLRTGRCSGLRRSHTRGNCQHLADRNRSPRRCRATVLRFQALKRLAQ
jgi:hypothetical protein